MRTPLRFAPTYQFTNVPAITIPYSQFQPGQSPPGHYHNLAPPTMSDGWCSKPFISDILPLLIDQHEGVTRESGSHTDAAYNWLADNAASIRDRAEALVFVPGTDMNAFSKKVFAFAVDTAAFRIAREVPDNDPNYGRFGPNGFDPNGCYVRYQE